MPEATAINQNEPENPDFTPETHSPALQSKQKQESNVLQTTKLSTIFQLAPMGIFRFADF